MYYYVATFNKMSGNSGINIINEISEEAYQVLNDSFLTISHFLFSNNYYKMLKNNINDLLSYIEKIEHDHNNSVLTFYDRNININRLTINLLGIFFSYINHFEHDLKEFRGKDSKQAQKFDCITSQYFDNYFEYRFLYKLRNYCVHCSIPITTFTSTLKEPLGKYYINSNDLLKNFDSWGPVKSDLEVIDNIDIKKLMQDSSIMFDKLHKELVLIDNFNIYTDLKKIENNMPKDVQNPVILISSLPIMEALQSPQLNVKIFNPFETMVLCTYEINKLGISASIIFDKDQRYGYIW